MFVDGGDREGNGLVRFRSVDRDTGFAFHNFTEECSRDHLGNVEQGENARALLEERGERNAEAVGIAQSLAVDLDPDDRHPAHPQLVVVENKADVSEGKRTILDDGAGEGNRLLETFVAHDPSWKGAITERAAANQ